MKVLLFILFLIVGNLFILLVGCSSNTPKQKEVGTERKEMPKPRQGKVRKVDHLGRIRFLLEHENSWSNGKLVELRMGKDDGIYTLTLRIDLWDKCGQIAYRDFSFYSQRSIESAAGNAMFFIKELDKRFDEKEKQE